jgi:large-conductance mechanosensitive channel
MMVSTTLFFVVKWINQLKKDKIKKDEKPKISELDVLVDIRDYLKNSKWK